ncbi:acyltransferase family protein [Spirosoma daeguense]
MKTRKANLDLLRAIAILIVIIYHLSQYLPTLPTPVYKVFSLGNYGVDIFFVLSGWLIGGIFFRDYVEHGNVNLFDFWGRRWLRTIPPYLIALFISWLSVYIVRGQKFDYSFLLFLQNYQPMPPYFMVSWSLCVEEHFYLILPLLLYIGLRFDIVIPICVATILYSFSMRLFMHAANYPDFGYWLTATHLRLDGLTTGVLCAYIYVVKTDLWKRFSLLIKLVGISMGGTAIYWFITNNALLYSFGILFLSLFFAGILCFCIDASDWVLSKNRVVSIVALSSYSLYLTHALAIHTAEAIVPDRGIIFILLALFLIFSSGYAFYYFIERLSIKSRDKIMPQKARLISVVSEPQIRT